MNKKGQVTVDFFYMVLGLILVIQALQAINSEFGTTQSVKTISSQIKQISQEISLVIDSTSILGQQNSKTTIVLDTGKLFVPNTIGKQACTIDVLDGKTIVSKKFSDTTTVKATEEFSNPLSFNISPSTLNCSQQINIQKT